MIPEFSRPFALARVGGGTTMTVEANEQECAAVARRMGVPAILSLTCRFDLHPAGPGTVRATGQLRARLIQSCVVSLEDFEAIVAEDFHLCFVPEEALEAEPDPESEDEVPYQGTHLDLGEAATEQLALAIPPFPRKPGAILPEDHGANEANLFAALLQSRAGKSEN
jgi:uncharacterized metal-binding protein YceD (DUF177 family)